MSGTVSTITVAGNVTRDPEPRSTNNGKSVTTIGIAVNRRRKKKRPGEPGAFDWVDEQTFIDVVAWADLAEHVVETLRKGDRVLVAGRIEQRSYTPKEGPTRTIFELVAEDVGVSLTRHTAEVARTERRGPESSGGYDDMDDGG